MTTANACSEIQSATISTQDDPRPDVRIVARYGTCDTSEFYADDDAENQNAAWIAAYGSGRNGPGHAC
jgi:hypothetical protein